MFHWLIVISIRHEDIFSMTSGRNQLFNTKYILIWTENKWFYVGVDIWWFLRTLIIPIIH